MAETEDSRSLLVKRRGKHGRKCSQNSLGCPYIKYGMTVVLFLVQALLSGCDTKQRSGILTFPKR